MTNKKICLVLVVAALVCGIILPACKDEPSPGAGDLVGKWGISGVTIFEIKENKDFSYSGWKIGTYTTDGSTLTITPTTGSPQSGTFNFDGFDTLTLSGFGGSLSVLNATYTRL
jgi:hypothetical protein